MRGMISHGFVSIRTTFARKPGEKGGAIAFTGISDHTLLRLHDGVAHMSITKAIAAEDVSAAEPLLTFLDGDGG
jgi:hypothetical protein